MTDSTKNPPVSPAEGGPAEMTEPLKKSPLPVAGGPSFLKWPLAALLAAITIILYWPATHHDFVGYDDDLYVTENIPVQNGLTLAGVKWAFCNQVSANWHPVTILSHMLDCQIFGLNPWGHHLTSLLLHALDTALVFLLLWSLTGALWRSATVAALFGWHPLHVESVAWVAERKDVLSTFFGLLALMAYVRYARNLEIKRQRIQVASSGRAGPRFFLSSPAYWGALICFTLGLMSKPMLVTWPFVLLLLDYWPLERFKAGRLWSLMIEKIPFLALTTVSCVVVFLVQKSAGAMVLGAQLPFGMRAENALISYGRYLDKLFWPSNLAFFYPYRGYWPIDQLLLTGVCLGGLTLMLFLNQRRAPFLLMGWLWFIGTLVPTIGLVQVGSQSIADRYTYIPSLGIFILVAWGAFEATRLWRHHNLALTVAGCTAMIFCLILTRQQLACWQNNETLCRHALKVTPNNFIAYNNLGANLADEGRNDEAISQLEEALRLQPHYADAHHNLGDAFLHERRIDEAIDEFKEADRLMPGNFKNHYNLSLAYLKQNRTKEAISELQETLRLNPNFAYAYQDLGEIYLGEGRVDDAISQYQKGIALGPKFPPPHNNLGIALSSKGQIDEAIDQFQEAIRLKPDYPDAHNNLGIVLSRKGRIDEAIEQFQEALKYKPNYAGAQNNLAKAMKLKELSIQPR